MSADFSNEEQGLINTVELAVDWGIPIPEELHDEYIRLINRGQQSEHKVQKSKQNKGQQSERSEGQQSGKA